MYGAMNGLWPFWNKDLFGSFENKSLKWFKKQKTSQIKADTENWKLNYQGDRFF